MSADRRRSGAAHRRGDAPLGSRRKRVGDRLLRRLLTSLRCGNSLACDNSPADKGAERAEAKGGVRAFAREMFELVRHPLS